MADIRRDPLFADSVYHVRSQGERFLIATHEKDGRKALGVFPIAPDNGVGYVEVDFPDGVYTNLITGDQAEVFRGGVSCTGQSIILIK